MSSICILTDSTAQFPQLGFSGRNDVRVVSFEVEINGQRYEEGQDLRASDLPATASEALRPRLIPPSVEQFETLFNNLSQYYDDVLAILASSSLNPVSINARQAAETAQGRSRVTVIDSLTTSVGLGLMVQTAAEAMANGMRAAEIERVVRAMIPHTYMMICTPALSYLYHAGFVDQGQAFVGEMLSLLPVFTLEEGVLSAVEKVRNTRGLVDFMQEFVCEFEELQHIAYLQSTPPLSHEAKMMREHAQACFPSTPFSEHMINLPLATLIGPRSVGLVAVEKPED